MLMFEFCMQMKNEQQRDATRRQQNGLETKGQRFPAIVGITLPPALPMPLPLSMSI